MVGEDGVPWVVSAVEVMRAAGCDPIGVVVGASADEVVALLAHSDVTIVPSPNWSDGLSASVRAGLAWAAESDAPAALFHMVNRPYVGASVVRRVMGAAPDTLVARASYNGQPGYPVLIARAHWSAAATAATGDRSMGPYLKRVPCPLIPCDDLTG
jgi:molybdenum cofactor cytidylyltransferase/nicotine blue oxidoreductase